jgi:hypothetical protein
MKLALLYNLNLTKVYINLEKYVICVNSCLFQFIRVDDGVEFMKHVKGKRKL